VCRVWLAGVGLIPVCISCTQLLGNAIHNACKSTGSGDILLHAAQFSVPARAGESGPLSPKQQWLLFEVISTGDGIADSDRLLMAQGYHVPPPSDVQHGIDCARLRQLTPDSLMHDNRCVWLTRCCMVSCHEFLLPIVLVTVAVPQRHRPVTFRHGVATTGAHTRPLARNGLV
jgi:hypothetical protein